MRELNFPKYPLQIKRSNDQLIVFDEVRKKWVVMTPEEWVRQNVLWYLVGDRSFKAGLIAVEKSLKYNGLTKRFDILCFDQNTEPFLIVECKAPEVAINRDTMEQALRYNAVVKAKYIALTNGMEMIVAKPDVESGGLEYVTEIPKFD